MKKFIFVLPILLAMMIVPLFLAGCGATTNSGNHWIEVQSVSWNGSNESSMFVASLTPIGSHIQQNQRDINKPLIRAGQFTNYNFSNNNLYGVITPSRITPFKDLEIGDCFYLRLGTGTVVRRYKLSSYIHNIISIRRIQNNEIQLRRADGAIQTIIANNIVVTYFSN